VGTPTISEAEAEAEAAAMTVAESGARLVSPPGVGWVAEGGRGTGADRWEGRARRTSASGEKEAARASSREMPSILVA
jgi:hypothetical protein